MSDTKTSSAVRYFMDGTRTMDYAEMRGISLRVAHSLFEKMGADRAIAYLAEEGHRYQRMPVNVPSLLEGQSPRGGGNVKSRASSRRGSTGQSREQGLVTH